MIMINRDVEISKRIVMTRVKEYVERVLFLGKHKGRKKRLIEYVLLLSANAAMTATRGARKPA